MIVPVRRRASVLVTASLAVSLAAAGPASTDCDQGLLACRTQHDSTEVAEVSVRRIAATLPVRSDNEGTSLEVYRSLVPATYEIPQPLVAVSFEEIDMPQRLAQAGVSDPWIEATVALRVRLGEEDGWYPIARLTDSTDVYDSGRDAGFPTSMATASLAPAGSGLVGQAGVQGVPAIEVGWQPANVFPSADTTSWAQLRQPFLSLSPVFEGPSRYRVKYTVKPPVPAYDWFREDTTPYAVSPSPEGLTSYGPQYKRMGMVRVNIDPQVNRFDAGSPDPLPDLPFGEGRSLADVIQTDQVVRGVLWQTDQMLVTQTDDLDDGRNGPIPVDPPLPPAAGGVSALPQGQLTSFAPALIVVPRGSSITFANLDLYDQHDMTHDVIADRFHGDKPLFSSGYTNPQQANSVTGVQGLSPGQYPFVCALHPSTMLGTLVVR